MLFKKSIIKVMEGGIRKRNMARLYTKKPGCVNRMNFQSISIDDSLPAMLLIPYGALVAFIVLVAEKIFSLIEFSKKLCLVI